MKNNKIVKGGKLRYFNSPCYFILFGSPISKVSVSNMRCYQFVNRDRELMITQETMP